MPNPFSSNVNQGIVDQAQQDQLLNAAMKGDPQARAQIFAQVRAGADPYHAQFLDYQEAHGGVSPQDLSKLYLQQKTGNANSPVYYNPETGQFHDQQKDSALFKIAQIAPGAIGGGLALAGLGAAGGAVPSAAGSAPELAAAGDLSGLGGAGAVGAGGGLAGVGEAGGVAGLGTAGAVGPGGGLGAAGDITGELGASTGTATGGVPQALGATSQAATGFGAAGSKWLPTLFNTGMQLGGAALGSHAAGKAAEQQAAQVQNALNLQKDLYGQSRQALMPYYQLGAGSLGRLGAFLGTKPAAAIPDGTLGSLGGK